MSVEPPQIVIQYSDPNGNITHQGVLGTNASGSSLLTSTFPTTSTGDSIGHYLYTEDTTKSLKFLNASGTEQGGHQFWHSSSTQAPIKVLETNRTETVINTQYNVDKSTQGTPILIDLPNLTQSTDTVVVFASPINQAPWNIVGVGNPIQVNQNTVNMVTGTTYYLTAFSTQLGQVTTNPDGTGIIDCTDLVSLPQPILTWESGQFNPSTIQTAILSDDLTITTQTNSSILSATDLTFNTVSVTSQIRDLQIKQTSVINQYISAAIYADGKPPLTPSTTVAQQYAYTPSWYFKNSFATNNKINWYAPAPSGLTVANLLGLYCSFFNGGVSTSNDNMPFLTIYTSVTGTNDYAPSFFHSSMTYIFSQSVSPTLNTRYTEFIGFNCPEPSHTGSTLVNMVQSPVNNPRGQYLPTETIAFFSISTNSAATINTIEIAVSKLGIMTADGTTEINYFM